MDFASVFMSILLFSADVIRLASPPNFKLTHYRLCRVLQPVDEGKLGAVEGGWAHQSSDSPGGCVVAPDWVRDKGLLANGNSVRCMRSSRKICSVARFAMRAERLESCNVRLLCGRAIPSASRFMERREQRS